MDLDFLSRPLKVPTENHKEDRLWCNQAYRFAARLPSLLTSGRAVDLQEPAFTRNKNLYKNAVSYKRKM